MTFCHHKAPLSSILNISYISSETLRTKGLLNIPDFILKLYILIQFISLATDKMVPGLAKAMEKTTNFRIHFRYLNLVKQISEDDFYSKCKIKDVTLKF